jgi:uncharacterized membrane protein YeiH
VLAGAACAAEIVAASRRGYDPSDRRSGAHPIDTPARVRRVATLQRSRRRSSFLLGSDCRHRGHPVLSEPRLIIAALVAFDLAGTFVFALSGAAAGVRYRLDLFGVLVLSFAAGNSGGIARDVMIGAIPPAAISDWRYLVVSILAGLIVFYCYRFINRIKSPVLLFDAAGLALFAVSGASKALAFHAGPVAAALLGMLTGVGGGMVRDVLVREIPTVLRTELYAVAALTGAAVVVAGPMLHVPSSDAAVVGAVLAFTLRFVAMRRGWRLPTADAPIPTEANDRADVE